MNAGKPIRIYLASRYHRKQELQAYRDRLDSITGCNIMVTARWLDTPQVTGVDGQDSIFIPDSAAVYAKQDFNDIANADVFVHFTDPPTTLYRRGGAHCEFGVALALGKRCMIVGPRQQIFHALPQVEQYEDIDELCSQFFTEGEY